MIHRGKAVLSSKLAKQLKALERKPKQVAFSLVLDAVADRVNTPTKRVRGECKQYKEQVKLTKRYSNV